MHQAPHHSKSLAHPQSKSPLNISGQLGDGINPTSLLLVDDSPSFLESALRFLSSDQRLEVVGLALNGQDALLQVEILHPDLVVMDWAMPEMDGLEATRRIKAGDHPPHVIILTLHDTDEYRNAARDAQADGFVSKSDFGVKLLPLIAEVLAQPIATAPAPIVVPVPSAAPPPRPEEPRPNYDGKAPRDFPDAPVAFSACPPSLCVVGTMFSTCC